MSRVGKQALIAALEGRFDFQSARNVLKRALKDTGLGDQSDYSTDDLTALGAAISDEAGRMEGVVAKFKDLAERAKAAEKPAKKPAKKAKPAQEAKAEEAEAAPEAKAADEAPAEKKPARSRRRRKKTASSD